MAISVRLPTVLRPHAAGKSSVEVSGSTVGDVVVDLVNRFPGMQGHLTDEGGQLQKFVNVYLNDEDIRYLEKMATPVADGDEVAILPAVAGGV